MEEEGNEEPETDFPLSNINRIYRYLGKEGERRLLELKDQVTSNPRVFGAQLGKLVVPENKEEMRRFLKKSCAAEGGNQIGGVLADYNRQGVWSSRICFS